ncbi:MAG TPA: hypothetical protein PL028_02930, partial [Bacteroidales bacterium]|nr:hypothetical protein [Bacteroidales bacterium]
PELAGCFAKILIKISFTLTLSSPIRLAFPHLSNIRNFPVVLIFNIGNSKPAWRQAGSKLDIILFILFTHI